MKMIYDDNYRTTATVGELEQYSRMLGSYARLIKQTISMFESLVKSRNVPEVNNLPIIKQYLLDQGEDFLKLETEFHDEIKDKNLYWNNKL